MAQLYRTLSLGNVGVFESPTGTGCVALLAQPPFVPLFAEGPSACTSAFVPGHVTFEQQPLPVAHRGGSRARLTGWVGFPPQGFFLKKKHGGYYFYGLWDYGIIISISGSATKKKVSPPEMPFFPKKNTFFLVPLVENGCCFHEKRGYLKGSIFSPSGKKSHSGAPEGGGHLVVLFSRGLKFSFLIWTAC